MGSELGRLFPAVFAATKRIRSETGIGANPVSIAYAIERLSKRIFSHLNQCQILLIGQVRRLNSFPRIYTTKARDIEPETVQLEDVYLYNIDDL